MDEIQRCVNQSSDTVNYINAYDTIVAKKEMNVVVVLVMYLVERWKNIQIQILIAVIIGLFVFVVQELIYVVWQSLV